ncbi:uncharacterized protein K452DRAFT_79309 [Aplosporella prunicola CBS 121167]|uniref:DUF6594 domain-containing protein n=1 Tax=Aplosporella prunicola CBS 121167 TaxID=1176127 RepID=A0A6A6B567_9PEZI|nr:uncharacterized protein K452DRAFT_79309 [Aplosporella prunicola CBS 121167]KAF2138996.1 hypothetical protein K452DRAFT_79309 [Aplosporella prunicola CBS 121167]
MASQKSNLVLFKITCQAMSNQLLSADEKVSCGPSAYPSTNPGRPRDCVIHIDSGTATAVGSPTRSKSWSSSMRTYSQLHISKIKAKRWKLPSFKRKSKDASLCLRPQTKKVEDYPLGYPRLAAFQTSDPSFSIYRGFGYLHSRVLLDLQYELSELEEELEERDSYDGQIEDTARRLRSRKTDDLESENSEPREDIDEDEYELRPRRVILKDIRETLVQYDEVLNKARRIGTLQKPNKRDFNSVANWFHNQKPLVQREWYTIKRQEDMLTLRQGREWAGFDGIVEAALRKCDCRLLQMIFRPRALTEKTEDKCVFYYASNRVETLCAVIITSVIFVLLVLPVFAMYKLTSFGDRSSTFDAIGVLVVFTLLFSAAMSLLTKAKRHELFAASAAYCAVLVVFISNFGSNDQNQFQTQN